MSNKENSSISEKKEVIIIGYLKSGEEVFVPPQSHYYTHPDTHDTIGLALGLISSETLSLDSCGVAHVAVEIPGVEGKSICVPVTEGDTFVYAIRHPRTWYTRFVIGKEPINTHTMTVVLKSHDRRFELYTSYWGPCAQREPNDPTLIPGSPEYLTSEQFWRHRALILPDNEVDMVAIGVDPQMVKEILDEGEEYFRS